MTAAKQSDVFYGIGREDVLDAFRDIRERGVPIRRRSVKFCCVHEGWHYPPKLLLSVASALANSGTPALENGLQPDDFAGGPQSNDFLKSLGFRVVACTCKGMKSPTSKRPQTTVPPIARVVVDGKADLDPEAAAKALVACGDVLVAADLFAHVMLTPGGFVRVTVDAEAPLGWRTPRNALRGLVVHLNEALSPLVDGLSHFAEQAAAFLTIGVDVMLDGGYAELVATYDVQLRRVIAWTGKSYPTLDQEDELLHVVELESHLQDLDGVRTLVLGCHDLNIFSPRSRSNRDPHGPRGRRADDFISLAKRFRPAVVLQHPHRTDTPLIWAGGWFGVRDTLKPTSYASGIAYATVGRGPRRAPLADVAEGTKYGNVVDVKWSRNKATVLE